MIAQTFLDLYRELRLRHYKKQDLELIFRAPRTCNSHFFWLVPPDLQTFYLSSRRNSKPSWQVWRALRTNRRRHPALGLSPRGVWR